MSQLPAVTDMRGRFLMPGCTVTYKDHKGRPCTGTVTTFNHGWARVRTEVGRMVTKKPTRIRVAA